MSAAENDSLGSCQKEDNDAPPPLSFKLPVSSELSNKSKRWSDDPVDIVLLTVEDCEFLACYAYMGNPIRRYHSDLGYVYFGTIGDDDDDDDDDNDNNQLKVALLKCFAGSSGPGAAQVVANDAVRILRPRAVFSVGYCEGLKPEKTRLGDVVVSSKLTFEDLKTPVGKSISHLIKHSGYGWKPPLERPDDAHQVKVHDGEILSCKDKETAKQLQSGAIAREMEGQGMFVAAHNLKMEWVIVKGISHFADSNKIPEESWKSHACVMAASLVFNMLNDTVVFKQWPHYKEEESPASQQKRDLPCSSSHDAKRRKIGTSAVESQDVKRRKISEAFPLEECQEWLKSKYYDMSKVKITPWDPCSAVHIDTIYTRSSWFKDDMTPRGVTKKKLYDYTEIFTSQEHPNLKRILVYGQPGIGKSTFCTKAAYDWSQQNKTNLRKFDLLLLIKLRDVCNLHDVSAILRASELLANDTNIAVDSLHKYIQENQDKVLIIFDGYDEYSYDDMRESPVHHIWDRKQLSGCTVVLTMRPTPELKSSLRFEINGFDEEEQVKLFSLKFLKDDSDFKKFYEYLKKHNLTEIAKIPLFLRMLCLFWTEIDSQTETTSRAHIYTLFIQTMFDHFSEKEDAKTFEFKKVDKYAEELSKLGKLAYDGLLKGDLILWKSELTDDLQIIINKFTEVGLCHAFKPSRVSPMERISFIHKSIQEYIAGMYLKELAVSSRNDEKATFLSELDSITKILKMKEVLKFASELSECSACAILNHLGKIAKDTGLTDNQESIAMQETPALLDISDHDFLMLTADIFLCCSAETRKYLFPTFLSYIGSVLLINSNQLHSIANEHVLKSTEPPNLIFFPPKISNDSERDYRDLVSVLEDLNAVVVCSSGVKSASQFLNKYPFRPIKDVFLKKKKNIMYLYFAALRDYDEESILIGSSAKSKDELGSSAKSRDKDREGNPLPEDEWPSVDYWNENPRGKPLSESRDEPGSSAESTDESGPSAESTDEPGSSAKLREKAYSLEFLPPACKGMKHNFISVSSDAVSLTDNEESLDLRSFLEVMGQQNQSQTGQPAVGVLPANIKYNSSSTVTSEGGVIDGEGFKLVVPPGAVDKPVFVNITLEDPYKYFRVLVQKDLENDVMFGAPIINLRPNGQVFKIPVTLTTKFTINDFSREDVIILHGTEARDGKITWEEINHNSRIDEAVEEVTTEMQHFSIRLVLIRRTWICIKYIVSRLNWLSFNYTLEVLIKKNNPDEKDELALLFMSQDVYNEEFYRERPETSALVQLKNEGFRTLHVRSIDEKEENQIHSNESLKVSVSLGEDYKLADSEHQSMSLTVEPGVWWNSGLVKKLKLETTKRVRILLGEITVKGEDGRTTVRHFNESDLCGYVRDVLDVKGVTVFNTMPIARLVNMTEHELESITEFWKGEDEQLDKIMKCWMNKNEVKDFSFLREALEGLKQEDYRVTQRGQMHIRNLRKLTSKTLECTVWKKEFPKAIADLCEMVFNDYFIESEGSPEGAKREAFMKKAEQQICLSSASESITKLFQTIVPNVIQNIKEIFVDEAAAEVHNGLRGLSEEILRSFSPTVEDAEQNNRVRPLVGAVCNILELLCQKNCGEKSIPKTWGKSLAIPKMLKFLKPFFLYCRQDSRLHKRLEHFSCLLYDIMVSSEDGDHLLVRYVSNITRSLINFAKFSASKLVRFQLNDSTNSRPVTCHGEIENCDKEFYQWFHIEKESEEGLQLHAIASVNSDGQVHMQREFSSTISARAESIVSLKLVYDWESKTIKIAEVLEGTSAKGPCSAVKRKREMSLPSSIVKRKKLANSEKNFQKTASGPPEVNVTLPKNEDLPKTSVPLDDRRLPIDFLLLTVKECEFLSCLAYMNPGFSRCYRIDLGHVYLGDMGKAKVAVMKCHMGSTGPGSSSGVVRDAVRVLGPKAVFCVGFCVGLNTDKIKLGDVVVSEKLITYAPSKVTQDAIEEHGVRVPLRNRLAKLINDVNAGWKAPLKDPRELEVKICCGALLSGPEVVDSNERCNELVKRFPDGIAIEMEGEGVFATAQDLDVEWIIIKGVSDYTDGKKSETNSWRPFASLMAASLTAHILSDPIVFQSWPHYGSGNTTTPSFSGSRREPEQARAFILDYPLRRSQWLLID